MRPAGRPDGPADSEEHHDQGASAPPVPKSLVSQGSWSCASAPTEAPAASPAPGAALPQGTGWRTGFRRQVKRVSVAVSGWPTSARRP
jgi:hypothetical protein